MQLISDNRDDILSPAAIQKHYHLKTIACEIPPLDTNAKILLLLGRNIKSAQGAQTNQQACFRTMFPAICCLKFALVISLGFAPASL